MTREVLKPHTALGYRPPVLEAFLSRIQAGSSPLRPRFQIVPALT